MSIFDGVLILFISSSLSLAAPKRISGIVMDDLGITVSRVAILDSEENTLTTSNCRGKFKVKANIGDTLTIDKEGYLRQDWIISEGHKIKITLPIDYSVFVNELRNHPKTNSIYYDSGQPLYLIDNKIWLSDMEILKPHIDPKEIKSIKVLKGTEAFKRFQNYSTNGVILIYTICENWKYQN